MTTFRPVGPDDAELLLRLQTAHQTHVLGEPDTSLDECRDLVTDPDLDPASVVALDDDGEPLGCALVYPAGSAASVELEVVVDPTRALDLLPDLLQRALSLARAAGGQRGHDRVDADQGCYRQDEQLAAALRDAGFTPATTFHRMRRELDDPVEHVIAAGVVVSREDEDESVLRRAHRLHTSTFVGHFGFVERSWEDWLAAHRSRSGTGAFWFATLEGTDAGFLHETSQFLEAEDAGYVLRLGVERAARGRGVAKALLLSAFEDMRERGRRAVLLHVDTANATGATALYESVGMRPVTVIDVWRASVATTY
jgi:mycothiol synthase